MPKLARWNKPGGFSLMEMLLVIVIVIIGLAILLPFLLKAQENANQQKCLSNLRRLGIACHNHQDAYKTFPPGYGLMNGQTGTFFFHLLPLLDETARRSISPASPVRAFQCPSDPSMPGSGVVQGWGASSYVFNAQVFCQVGKDGSLLSGPDWQQGTLTTGADPAAFPLVPDSFGDGASQTIILAERYAQCGGEPIHAGYYANQWAYPFNGHDYCPYFAARKGYVGYLEHNALFQLQPTRFNTTACNPHRPSTGHREGIQVCLGDASTRTLLKNITSEVFWVLCTPNGRDLTGSNW